MDGLKAMSDVVDLAAPQPIRPSAPDPSARLNTIKSVGLTAFLTAAFFVAVAFRVGSDSVAIALKTAFGIIACFIVLGFVFYVIEARWPEDKLQTPWKRESGISGFFLIFNLLVTLRIAESVVLTCVAVFAIMHIPRLSPTVISHQPLVLQLIELAIIKDFLMYWSHRMFHEIPFLWRFHAVHHSAKNVNWIDSGREHPLESIISKMTTLLPLVLLGFPPTILGPYVGIWTVFTMLLHSNCTWDYGKFRNFVVSPAFHRWHHSSDEAALDKNYASLLPIWDFIFRTAYFPKGEHSKTYGLYEQELPETMLHQLVGPFQPKDQSTDATPIVAPARMDAAS